MKPLALFAMRRKYMIGLITILSLYGLMLGCKGKSPQPLSEKIAKVWTPQQVAESSVVVYTKGASTNIRDYSKFSLSLSNTSVASITYQTGLTSTGQWAVNGDTQLILSNLVPIPTGTNGTITFTIISATDSQLVIKRSDTDLKTGATESTYTLTNP